MRAHIVQSIIYYYLQFISHAQFNQLQMISCLSPPLRGRVCPAQSTTTYTEDFQIFATQSEKRAPLRHLLPFHVPRAASDVEDHVFCFALYGVVKIWKSLVVHTITQQANNHNMLTRRQ